MAGPCGVDADAEAFWIDEAGVVWPAVASGNCPKTFGLFRFLRIQVEKQRSQKVDTAMYYLKQ